MEDKRNEEIKILGPSVFHYYVLSEVSVIQIDEEFSKISYRVINNLQEIEYISESELNQFRDKYVSAQTLYDYLVKTYKNYHSYLTFFDNKNIDEELKLFKIRGFLKSKTYVEQIETYGNSFTKSIHDDYDFPSEETLKINDLILTEKFDEKEEILLPKTEKKLKFFLFGRIGSGKTSMIKQLLGNDLIEQLNSKKMDKSKIFTSYENHLFNNDKLNIIAEVTECADLFNIQNVNHNDIALEFAQYLIFEKFDLIIYTIPADLNRLTTSEVLLIRILLEFLSVKNKNDMAVMITKLDKLNQDSKGDIKKVLAEHWLPKLNIEISPHQISNIFVLDRNKSQINFGLNGIVNMALSNQEKNVKISIKFPDLTQLYLIGKETLFGSELSGELSKLESVKKKNALLKAKNVDNLQIYIDNLVIINRNYFSIFQNKQEPTDLQTYLFPNCTYNFNLFIFGPGASGKSTLCNYLIGNKTGPILDKNGNKFKMINGNYLGKMQNVNLNILDSPGTDDIKYFKNNTYFLEFNEIVPQKLINLVLYVIRIDRIKVTRDSILAQMLEYCYSCHNNLIENNIVFVFTFVDKLSYEESCIIKKKIDNFIHEMNSYLGRKNLIIKFCIFNIEKEDKNYCLDDIIKYAANSQEIILTFNKIII